jgi:glycosyl hydrolase family 26
LRLNRSLLTAIAIPVVILISVGVFLLTSQHGGGSGGQALPGAGIGQDPLPSPLPSASTQPRKKPHKARDAVLPPGFVGVAVNGHIRSTVRSFTRSTGVHPAVVELYTEFGTPFPRLQARRVISSGSTPFIQWNPRHATLTQIAGGRYNRYVRNFAGAIKGFGHPVVLSFAHEMNGTWYSWGRPHSTPAQFKAAWRRIHAGFAHAHATNVTWSWDPSHVGSPASEWWPGKKYVDVVGIDGYQRPGQTFKQIFSRQLANIRHITSKPVFIAETAVAPSAGQASQVAGLFQGLSRYKLIGFVWFDINRLRAWRLEGRPAAVRAFRRSAARLDRHGGNLTG